MALLLGSTVLGVTSSLCLMVCSVGPEGLPDCRKSGESCCGVDPRSCSRFLICLKGALYSGICDPTSGFNSTELRCSESACLPQCRRACASAGVPPNCLNEPDDCCQVIPYNCKYFFTCKDGSINIAQCPAGFTFNDVTLSCQPGVNCPPDFGTRSTTRLCPPGGVECPRSLSCIQAPVDACSSTTFALCQSGRRLIETCSPGTRFNRRTLECDEEAFRECNDNVEEDKVIEEEEKDTVPSHRLLSRDEFLSALYSLYVFLAEKLSWR